MQIKKYRKAVLTAAILCLLAGCGRTSEIVWEETASESETQTPAGVQAEENDAGRADAAGGKQQKQSVTVDICGAVANPGVYVLEEGARVCDAVARAGGLLAEADRSAINQAALLHDADKVIVYTVEETQSGAAGIRDGMAAGAQAKVNINTAGAEELCTLKGIGQSRAEDIIAYRTANGPFGTIEEIMNVNGIKEATFTKIKDNISVG